MTGSIGFHDVVKLKLSCGRRSRARASVVVLGVEVGVVDVEPKIFVRLRGGAELDALGGGVTDVDGIEERTGVLDQIAEVVVKIGGGERELVVEQRLRRADFPAEIRLGLEIRVTDAEAKKPGE